MSQNENILITGGNGFIASELINFLKKKKIFIITKKKITKKYKKHKNYICDLTNKKQTFLVIKKIKPKFVYHLAWHGIPKFNKSNFIMNKRITNNLIYALNKIDCKKIIVSGSCLEYGTSGISKKENANINKIDNELGIQKNKIRNIFQKKLRKDIKLIWARIFYVYGKNSRAGSLLHSIRLARLENRKDFFINNPNNLNDFIFIKDVITALDFIKQKQNISSIINICNEKLISNYDFVKKYFMRKKHKIDIKFMNKKKTILSGSNLKLKKLGWRQKYSLVKTFDQL